VITSEGNLLHAVLGVPASFWDESSMQRIASLTFPERLLGKQAYIMRSDVYQQWSNWFLEGLANPLNYLGREYGYPHVVLDVFNAIKIFFPDRTIPEIKQLARVSSKLIYERVEVLRRVRRRISLDKKERINLLDIAGESPRCWLCGKKFSDEAIENFGEKTSHKLPLPYFIDVYRPSGLKEQDLRIEADHVNSFSNGGEEEGNLKLACGWCNRHKSSLSSLYQVGGNSRIAGENSLGITVLPQKFWIVRFLALARICDHNLGCESNCENSEMTVYVHNNKGSFNPFNLKVVCHNHDPISHLRYQSPDVVRKIWGIKK
jgi:5-methylcytosine-specific restriction endonuclease McrA